MIIKEKQILTSRKFKPIRLCFFYLFLSSCLSFKLVLNPRLSIVSSSALY